MKRTLLCAALLVAGIAGAALPLQAAPSVDGPSRSTGAHVPDPARQVQDIARLFRASDIAGLAQALVPPSKWEEMRLGYELMQLQPISDDERARFAEKIDRLTAPDAVDQLMVEIEPELEKARPQAAGALLMAFGAMQMAVASPESDLTEDQRAALQSALPGVQKWASTTDFLSSETMRQALGLLTDAARRTGISDIDQLKALPLEHALQHAGSVLAAAKDAARLYGIDVDAIADSLRVEVLRIDGDTATVRTTVTVFDAPVWADHELVLVEGRWYDKHAVSAIHVGRDDVEG